MNLVKNIDDELNTLLKIKEEVVRINFIKGLDIKAEFVSACKYDQLRSNQLLDNDTIYYVVDPEIGQYIEGYIE
jgi:hypothetical protein